MSFNLPKLAAEAGSSSTLGRGGPPRFRSVNNRLVSRSPTRIRHGSDLNSLSLTLHPPRT